MDAFDFQAVLKVLDVYKTMERGYPKDWVLDGGFFEPSVRAAARDCMKAAAKEGFAGHSYFTAQLNEGVDDDGPWVKMELFFGDRTYHDGVGYEK